jgi:hypothetical protein
MTASAKRRKLDLPKDNRDSPTGWMCSPLNLKQSKSNVTAAMTLIVPAGVMISAVMTGSSVKSSSMAMQMSFARHAPIGAQLA